MNVGSLNFQFGASGADDVERAANRSKDALQEIDQAQDQVASSSSSMGSSVSSTANNLGFEFTQAAQDAKFGLAGVANQVPLLSEQFTRLRNQTGSTTGAFSALFKSLKGPTGIIAGFTLLLTFKDEIKSFFQGAAESAASATEQVESLKGATDSLISGFSEELPEFQITSVGEAEDLEGGLSDSIQQRAALIQDLKNAQQRGSGALGANFSRDALRFAELSSGAIDDLIAKNQSQLQQEKALRSVLQEKIQQRKSAQQQQRILNGALGNGIKILKDQKELAEGLQQALSNASSVEPTTQVEAAPTAQGTGLAQSIKNLNIKRLPKRFNRTKNAGKVAMGAISQSVRGLNSGLASAITGAKSVGNAFRRMGKQILSALTGVIAKLSVAAGLAAVLSTVGGGALNLGTSFGGVFSSLVGLDSGGMVLSDGIAKVHKGEAVVNQEMMRNMGGGGAGGARVQSAGTAKLAAGNIQIPVEVIETANRVGEKNQARVGRLGR